jgi:polar amino acid transport system substrate-binding protein
MRTTSGRRSAVVTAAVVAAGALALAGCGRPGTAGESGPPLSAAPVSAPIAAIAAAKPCKDGLSPVASLDPGAIRADDRSTWPSVNDSPTLKAIRARNRLVVGTSGDVLLWGARDPESGQLKGFDIEVIKKVAGVLDVEVSYKVINYAQRLTALEDRSVDLVAHTMTINCDRWQGTGKAPNAINFSAEYYRAGQKVLIRGDDKKTKKIEDLKGQKVCVPAASTNVTQVQDMGLDLVELDVIGDCLVKFQEGEVVAVTGDDTVLAGFADQDPYADVIGTAFSAEPYGLGIRQDDPEFTRLINAILEDLRRSGQLRQIYADTMGKALPGTTFTVPQPEYGRRIAQLDRANG